MPAQKGGAAMPGTQDSKLKTLWLLRFLQQYTDEQHGLTVEEIIGKLAAKDIKAERKSIYTDLEILRTFGYEIEVTRGVRTEYRLISGDFELPELKLLVDAVSSSRFITRKKSLALIKKLEGLTSVYQASALQRSVYVDHRVKSMNESIFYSVDKIQVAIAQNHQIDFQYFSYDAKKNRVLRHDGARYHISPLALTFSDGNYYLYGCVPDDDAVRTYRVDRMVSVQVSAKKREIPPKLRNFEPAEYSNQMFSMYGGERKSVTLSFADRMANVVIDRFGTGIIMVPDGAGRFTVNIHALVSPNFLSWVFGFGSDAKILAPRDVADAFYAMVKDAAALYKEP